MVREGRLYPRISKAQSVALRILRDARCDVYGRVTIFAFGDPVRATWMTWHESRAKTQTVAVPTFRALLRERCIDQAEHDGSYKITIIGEGALRQYDRKQADV